MLTALYGIVATIAVVIVLKEMRQIYTLTFYFMMPFILLRLWWRGRKQPHYRKRLKERFGYPSFAKQTESFWIHAVSYGEVVAAEALVNAIEIHYPNHKIIMTTMTITGSQRVQKNLPHIYHCYVPYDIPLFMQRFCNHINPKIIIILETELWPNMLAAAKKYNIPIFLANARLSLRSLSGYRHLPRSMLKLLQNLRMVATQTSEDAQRFLALGLAVDRVVTAGNLKFDTKIPLNLIEQGKNIRHSWQAYEHVWVATSTHEGEEDLLLQAQRELLNIFPKLLFILVPRHPERFATITKKCQEAGYVVAKRSAGFNFPSQTQILIGDSMGELFLYYALADVAFIGGSLVPIGGHNLLEPAATQLPILTGPYLNNFSMISAVLQEAGVLSIVKNKEEIIILLTQLFNDKQSAIRSGEPGLEIIAKYRGSLDRHMELLREIVG